VDVPESGCATDEHDQDRQFRIFVLHRCRSLLRLRLGNGRAYRKKKPSKNAYSEHPKHSMLNVASLPQKAHLSTAAPMGLDMVT
jgi:hypothetical protein